MTSLSDVPLGAWASIGHPRQFDAPLDNEPPYDRFEMFSFDEYLLNSEMNRHNADLVLRLQVKNRFRPYGPFA